MASNRRFYEVDVTVAFNGATCNSLDVQFEKPSECANIRCEYSEGKILVEIPNDCSECVYAIVTCNDDSCAVCNEPERIKICPCDNSADCADCEECINSVCVSSCTDDQHCSAEGICVDCDEEFPCPNNQECVAGKCQCPPDKPILNDKGVCVSCDEEFPCPPCTYCTPDGCKPIDCPTGVCNPDTGECDECNGTGDCIKDNECCVNNKCDCCKGFKRDYATGECIPEGCTTDNDCEECEICYQGKCIPRECPDGYICVGDDCVPECDCADATCGKSEACVAADANKCYCKPCEGACNENSDCGEGCICKDGNCVPNPCKGGCANGTDCGQGCGCDDDGECVPCDSYSCANDDCSEILGCACLGSGCKDVGGCDGDCASSYDCAKGCTCYKGECTPCADFSCDSNECANQPGCSCIDGKCGGTGGPGGPGDDGCNDEFNISKDDSKCELTVELTKDEDCSCSKLTIDTKLLKVVTEAGTGPVPTKNGLGVYLLDMLVELRKGSVNSVSAVSTIPLLGDTNDENIADNEKPTSGVVEIFVTTTYREVDSSGLFVGFSTGPVKKYSASMVDKDSHTFTNIAIEEIGSQKFQSLFVHKVDVEIRQATDIEFPNNCTYVGPEDVDSFTITSNDDFEDIIAGNSLKKLEFAGFTTISSLSARHPMLVWYRSDDGTYSSNEIIRKVYVPSNSEGTYTDGLYGLGEIPDGKYPLEPPEGELWPGKYYNVKTDCGCDKDADAGKVVFCNPTDGLSYEMGQCNKEITLLDDGSFTPCSVNQDITQFNGPGYTIPSSVQTKYFLYLNGELQGTFVHNATLGMVKEGTSDSMFGDYDMDEPITEIKLVMNHDDNDECTIVYNIEPVDDIEIDSETNCAVTGEDYQITVPKVGGNYVIESIASSHGTVVNGTGSFILTLPKATSVTVTYNLENGCQIIKTFNEDCCDEFDITLITSYDGCGGDLTIAVIPIGGQGPYDVMYTYPDAEVGPVPNKGGDDTIPSHVVANPISGTYTVKVTDINGCTVTKSFVATVTNPPNVTFTGYKDICAGESTSIDISVPAHAIGATINYTADGNASSLVVPSSGNVSIGPINTAGEYVFTSIVLNSCTFQLDTVINIDIIPPTTVTVSTDPVGGIACVGSDVVFSIEGGVEGCVLELVSGGVVLSTTTFDSNGEASFKRNPTSTAVYTIRTNDSCSLDCLSGLPFTKTITVVDGPVITLTDNVCDATLTNRTITFDNIDSAVDQNGDPITVVGNSITVNPNSVNSVSITYNDGNCEVTSTFSVYPCDCPDITITLEDQVINSGDSATLTPVVSGGSGSYSYSWSTGQTTPSITVSPTVTTSYTVIITDNTNGCITSKIVTVIVVDCEGEISGLTLSSCSCDSFFCNFTFSVNLAIDFGGCEFNTGASDVQVFVDGSPTGQTVLLGSNNTFTLSLDGGASCPDPTSLAFAGTVVLQDNTGNSCCDGTTLDVNETILRSGQPGGTWGCNC